MPELDLTAAVVEATAVISECGTFRYSLTRQWHPRKPRMCVVMLNPSVASATLDDPTIRRVCGFAERDGFGSFSVVNLFAYRGTDPAVLEEVMGTSIVPAKILEGVGSENDDHILFEANGASKVVVAWGALANPKMLKSTKWPGPVVRRAEAVRALLERHELFCWGVTASGAPRHPLYVAGNTPLSPWPAL